VEQSLEQLYRDYIAALNRRDFNELGQFVHDQLTYNNELWTLSRYQALLAEDVQRIPDLHYEIQLLVTHEDHVACRLWFDCTPRSEFLGIQTQGRNVSFAEHVFYRFREKRIANVWSVVDADSIRRQLGSS
jgi:predicted ester cyclase